MDAMQLIKLDAETINVCERAVKYYGMAHQVAKAVEEANELELAIQNKDPKNQIEEVADVSIMCIQINRYRAPHRYTISKDGTVTGLTIQVMVRDVLKNHKLTDIGESELPQIYLQIGRKIERLKSYMESESGWLPGYKKADLKKIV